MCEVDTIFTAATGASHTVLSTTLYDTILESSRPNLKRCKMLSGPNGKPLASRGKGTFNIELGPLNVSADMIVTNIKNNALLGIDVLKDTELGRPADILLGQNIIRMGNMSIPCLEVHDPPSSRRVITVDHCMIPSHSQAVIDVFIHRYITRKTFGNRTD